MKRPGTECGELIGGPQDGGHVHTTPDQGRYGVVSVPMFSNPLQTPPRAPGELPDELATPYYLRGRRDDGTLRWVHGSMIDAAARRSDPGAGDG